MHQGSHGSLLVPLLGQDVIPVGFTPAMSFMVWENIWIMEYDLHQVWIYKRAGTTVPSMHTTLWIITMVQIVKKCTVYGIDYCLLMQQTTDSKLCAVRPLKKHNLLTRCYYFICLSPPFAQHSHHRWMCRCVGRGLGIQDRKVGRSNRKILRSK